MRVRAALFGVGLAACLALPTVASASRAPTGAETKAITAAVAAYVKNPSSHAASDNKVAKILVSTIDKRFAGARLTSVSGSSTALVERVGSHWKVIGFGSPQACPANRPPTSAVYKELGIRCGTP